MVDVIFSFDIVYAGELQTQIDELFDALDTSGPAKNGKLTIWELMKPIIISRDNAARQHQEFMAEESEPITKAGRLYTVIL